VFKSLAGEHKTPERIQRILKTGDRRGTERLMSWSVFAKVKEALDSEDIEGLLSLGAPPDEYHGEATLIEGRIAKATSFGKRRVDVAELENIVREVWNSEFGPFSDAQLEQRPAAFHAVARRIVD